MQPILEDPGAGRMDSGKRSPELHAEAARIGMQYPGQWVRVGKFAPGLAYSIKHGSHKAYPGVWDASTRLKEIDGVRGRWLYVRYLGKKSAQDSA